VNDVDNAMKSGVKLLGDPFDSEIVGAEESNLSVKRLGRPGSSCACHGMQTTTVWVKKWLEEWAIRNRDSSVCRKINHSMLFRYDKQLSMVKKPSLSE
jgi:hypothetical protein